MIGTPYVLDIVNPLSNADSSPWPTTNRHIGVIVA
jgi:hypothetical protein